MRILARDGSGCRGDPRHGRTPTHRQASPAAVSLLVLALASLDPFPAFAVAPASSSPARVAGAASGSGGTSDSGDAADGPDGGRASADPSAVPDGTFLRVTIDGGVSPFTSVSWDVTVRGSTAVVSHVKETLCQTGQRERVRLLEGANARSLLDTLRSAGAWTCPVPPAAVSGRAPDRPAPADQPRYEVWSAWGRRMLRYHLSQSDLGNAPCTLALFTVLVSEVRARVEPLPMRDLYYPADRLGFVTMTVSEPATATIDGWDTVYLPADALEVVEGEHVVVVTGESGRTRQFKVKVAPGLTQRIHVLLEDPPDGGGAVVPPLK